MSDIKTIGKLEKIIEQKYGKSWKDIDPVERIFINTEIECAYVRNPDLSDKEREIWKVIQLMIYGPEFWSEEEVVNGALKDMKKAGFK